MAGSLLRSLSSIRARRAVGCLGERSARTEDFTVSRRLRQPGGIRFLLSFGDFPGFQAPTTMVEPFSHSAQGILDGKARITLGKSSIQCARLSPH